MRDRGLTLKVVASMAEVSLSTVADWQSGTSPADLQAVNRLARSLGVSFSYLLLGVADDVMRPSSFAEIFDETDLFNGIVRISIKKLNVRE
jgi:transcriptional regulator with XRE-family HTH domain